MKKLIAALMITLLLAGCSGKKKVPVKEEPVKEETTIVESVSSVKDIYGTWRTCAVSIKDARFSIDQIDAMGERDSVDAIFVISEDGMLHAYVAYDGSLNETTWSAGEDNSSIIIEGQELPIIDGEIAFGTEEATVYLGKISDRQDKEIIDELIEEESKNTVEESEPEPVQPETKEEVREETTSDTIRPEVREAIDAYEDFVDEYIAFMEKYAESDGTDLSLLMDYTKFMSNLTEYTDKMEALEDDMTDAETIYYIEVMNRCNEKMIKSLD